MKDWLTKYGIALSGLFLTGLNIYLNLQNWKKQGANLTGTALNAVITFFLWAILVIASITFSSRQKKLNERMRQCDLTGPIAVQIKRAGTLESLAGRADWLAQFLEEVWHEFDKEKQNIPNPIGIRSMPDVIERWTDKQLWRFRTNHKSYLGSMDAIDPECDSDLMKDKFPHEGEDYLSVKRKIEAHATVMRRRADELLSKAKAQMDN
jgi:hypothetical protein